MAWALQELQLHQLVERQGVPRATLNKGRHMWGQPTPPPQVRNTRHTARVQTHSLTFCITRMQGIPAIAIW